MPSAGGTWVKLPGVVNNALCKDQRAPPQPGVCSKRNIVADAPFGRFMRMDRGYTS